MSYTNIMNVTAAIIPVAGLSSRMGEFKPLLELNGFPMIGLTVQSALDGGAEQVCIVTGRNASEVQEALFAVGKNTSVVKGLAEPPKLNASPLIFTQNAEFASTDMLQSIKLGLRSLMESASGRAPGAIFLLPGDMPGIRPHTFRALERERTQAEAPVLVPTCSGKRGHPLLVSSECFETILAFEGEGGLKQALAGFDWLEVAVNDPGILLDADTPEAFALLESHIKQTKGVSRSIVSELYAHYQTPENVQAHTQAVAEVAYRMATQLSMQGFGMDAELCRSGGLLHDLNRLEPDHSEVAAVNLRALGYEALAQVVAAHDRALKLTPRFFSEANLVFVADKLVKETTLVKIEQRYKGAIKRFPLDTELGQLIQRDSESAQELLQRYCESTNDTALLNGAEKFVRSSYAET